jgi:hypothetical protein
MTDTRRRSPIVLACLAAVLLTAAACSSSGGGKPAASPPVTTAAPPASTVSAPSSSPSSAASAVSLKGVCPDPLVIQSNWYPEIDHYADYALIGPDGTMDVKAGTYSGQVAGITVQVRVGGPFVGYQPDTALMYLHKEIFLADERTDDQITASGRQPVVAVMAPLQKSPLGIMYDPAHYNFSTLADVGHSGASVLTALQNTGTDLLTELGYINKSQWSYGWDGSPARFVVAGGKDVAWDFMDQDVYNYENTITQWHKPVKFLLGADFGYAPYEGSFVVTPTTLQTKSACLQKLIPMMQTADVDFLKNPQPLSNMLIKFAAALKSPTVLSTGLNDFEIKFETDHGMFANGPDGTFGSFDPDRVQKYIDALQPVLKTENANAKPGLTAADLVTNKFLDTSIHI